MENITKIIIAFSICDMFYLESNILNQPNLIKILKKKPRRKKILKKSPNFLFLNPIKVDLEFTSGLCIKKIESAETLTRTNQSHH